ncbi:MAG TPA: PKD domain-containing protein [Thermoplasmatales archaeon]|nr:PKD domain-containing protein [Thermoplasmatales archaeon]
MNGKRIWILLFITLAWSLSTSMVISESKDIYVDSSYKGYSDGTAERPYTSIQHAIDIADEGDTIYVFGGSYDETIVVDKRVRLWGSIDGKPSIIDTRTDKRYTIEVKADYAEIQDFTISDVGDHKSSPIGALIAIEADNVVIQGNHLNNTKSYAIYLSSSGEGNVISGNTINNTARGICGEGSDTNDIFNNIIGNCSQYAIYLSSSDNNRVYGNYISNSNQGVYVTKCEMVNISNNSISSIDYYGIYLDYGTTGKIRYNTINNTGIGIYLEGTSINIYENSFNYNNRGITLAGSSNTIENNSFSNSSASGIYTLPSSTNNIIYHNTFRDNGMSAREEGSNQWSKNAEGNYWDDYNYIDRNRDGIGDRPYNKNGVIDNFPLGFFLKPPDKPTNPRPEDTATGVGLKITLQVDVEDSDSDYLTVYFYRADTNELLGIDKKVPSGGTAKYSFTQPFDTTFAWYTIANDSLQENRSDTWFFTTMVTPPNNNPPVADAGGPYSAAPDEPITFDGSNSYDSDGEIKFYRWNFGDGTSEILAEKPVHTYKSPGDYTVTLTVIDNLGTTDTSITTAAIRGVPNQKPIAIIQTPESGRTSEDIVFNGVNSSDPDGNIVNYTWNFGDGSIGYGVITTHVYTEPGTYLVILTVTDDHGKTDVAQDTITIEKAVEEKTPGFGYSLLLLAIFILLADRKRRW